MAENETFSVELKRSQFEYLEKMASKYDLPDTSKALRCLINHAVERPEHEQDVFETIRCPDC